MLEIPNNYFGLIPIIKIQKYGPTQKWAKNIFRMDYEG